MVGTCKIFGVKPSNPNLSGSLLKDATRQILGLATALSAAHNLNNTEASYCHGDFKPENILVFTSEDGSLGTFKIGDWGEAKYHKGRTEMRFMKKTARYGTLRYEAPEVVTGLKSKLKDQPEKRRSRLYDVWSMGCIMLECIVWLLYGLDGIKRLQETYLPLSTKSLTRTGERLHESMMPQSAGCIICHKSQHMESVLLLLAIFWILSGALCWW